jgi:ferredoxin
MKVIVDRDLCEANAVCMDCCPEVFRVGDDDTLQILVDKVSEAQRAAVGEAVRLCPRQALSLEG